MLLKN